MCLRGYLIEQSADGDNIDALKQELSDEDLVTPNGDIASLPDDDEVDVYT